MHDLDGFLALDDVHWRGVQPTGRGVVGLLQVLEEPTHLVGEFGRLWKRQHPQMIARLGALATRAVARARPRGARAGQTVNQPVSNICV